MASRCCYRRRCLHLHLHLRFPFLLRLHLAVVVGVVFLIPNGHWYSRRDRIGIGIGIGVRPGLHWLGAPLQQLLLQPPFVLPTATSRQSSKTSADANNTKKVGSQKREGMPNAI